jgi:hypothetical protein
MPLGDGATRDRRLVRATPMGMGVVRRRRRKLPASVFSIRPPCALLPWCVCLPCVPPGPVRVFRVCASACVSRPRVCARKCVAASIKIDRTPGPPDIRIVASLSSLATWMAGDTVGSRPPGAARADRQRGGAAGAGTRDRLPGNRGLPPSARGRFSSNRPHASSSNRPHATPPVPSRRSTAVSWQAAKRRPARTSSAAVDLLHVPPAVGAWLVRLRAVRSLSSGRVVAGPFSVVGPGRCWAHTGARPRRRTGAPARAARRERVPFPEKRRVQSFVRRRFS